MIEGQYLRQIRNVLITALVLVVIAAGAQVLRLVALAILLSFILAPVATWLVKRGLPHVAAVVLTIVLALGGTSIVAYVVSTQVGALAAALPRYESNILGKLEAMRFLSDSPLSRLNEVAENVKQRLEPEAPVSKVRVVERPGPLERIREVVEPAMYVGEAVFVCVFLVLLMLLEREELSHRIVKLWGRGHIGVSTKTITQIGNRLSRYLASFSLVNLATGICVGVGLWVIGLPYATLWGVLGGLLRYIPFVGPTLAFSLPVIFSFAHFDNLHQPALVIGWYLLIEVVTTILEPYLYGKTTGISAVALFVSALIWTYLWGPLGLLMATPLTVCLVVLGKSVPSLGFLATLLSENPEIRDDERFYQRLLRTDQEGAIELLEAQAAARPLEEVFDHVMIPALGRARADIQDGLLSERDWDRMEAILVDWIQDAAAQSLLKNDEALPEGLSPAALAADPPRLVGVAPDAGPDDLALHMLNALLVRASISMKVLGGKATPLEMGEALAQAEPDFVVLSSFPWLGLTRVRYLTKRLQVAVGDVPIVIGVWDQSLDLVKVSESVKPGGLSRVVLSLAGARDAIFEQLRTKTEGDKGLAALSLPEKDNAPGKKESTHEHAMAGH